MEGPRHLALGARGRGRRRRGAPRDARHDPSFFIRPPVRVALAPRGRWHVERTEDIPMARVRDIVRVAPRALLVGAHNGATGPSWHLGGRAPRARGLALPRRSFRAR